MNVPYPVIYRTPHNIHPVNDFTRHMKKTLALSLYLLLASLTLPLFAQMNRTTSTLPIGGQNREHGFSTDSVERTNVPEGIYVWTVDPYSGNTLPAVFDTIPHLFPNEAFTSGKTGHFNFTGNLGAPRVSRFFNEQNFDSMWEPFLFKKPYDYFLTAPSDLHFTNTKSPFTNLTYHECGNKENGEDRLGASFAVNAGKKFGAGFKADYIYGRGYYQAQSTAHFNGSLYASYVDDNYKMHLIINHTQLKNRENGGIENDDYVNRPESYPTKYAPADMPVNLARAWNKMEENSVFLSNRYSLGFQRWRDGKGRIVHKDSVAAIIARQTQTARKDTAGVAAVGLKTSTADSTAKTMRLPRGGFLTEKEKTDSLSKAAAIPDSMKIHSEFVPVTSFAHTLRLQDDARRFMSNQRNNATNPGFFKDFYLPGDSAFDRTDHLLMENTLLVELHEGMNKWMKSGIQLFARHAFNRFVLPEADRISTKAYIENYFTVGARLLKQQGRTFRYQLLGELRTSGKDWGEFKVGGDATLCIPLKKDSLKFTFQGEIKNELPSFYYRHYHGRNAWWDNDDLKHELKTVLDGKLQYKQTSLSVRLQNIQNYTYFAEALEPYQMSDGVTNYRHGVTRRQAASNVQLLGITLNHDQRWGIFHWDNELTYQATTNKEVYPVPTFNLYSNFYVQFRIAKVLKTELGADLVFFTAYHAPTYSPIIGQYAVQDLNHAEKIGNYPMVNVYANFHLKRTRFYLMASHVNSSQGSGNPFLVPHYPMNQMVIRLGISWNFIN